MIRHGRVGLSITLLIGSSLTFVQAQDYDRVAPQLPSRTPAPTLVSPATLMPVSTSGERLVPSLNGLVFVSGPDRIVSEGLPASAGKAAGIDLTRTPELNDPHFTTQLTPFLNKPLTPAVLDKVKALTTAWLRAHQRPFTDVTIPPQNIASGVVQIVVTQYRVGQVKVAGARHFSPSLIRETSGLQPGQTLRLDALQTDLDRLNRNPFLTVDAVFDPGSQTGETDVTLKASDRLPLRFYSGYDNLGVRSLGVAEYNAGVNWGNAFGTGQIVSYQFTRSFTGQSTSHSISDAIPLPWGDQLLVFGSYGTQQPSINSFFNEGGHSGQASIRYVRSLPRARSFTQDVQIGYDFKTTDNNLEFAGFQIFANEAEVDQFPLIYEANLSDHLGATAVQNTFVYSPGRLTANNNTAALSSLVPGTRAAYFYNRFLVTRTTPLPKHFSAVSRVTVQQSDHNLPYSEQIGGGGVGSVRGYYTDTALGTDGEMFSQELRLPAFTPSRLAWRDSEFGDKAQVGGFFDYASLRQVTPIPDVQNHVILASTGFLARYSFSRSLDVQFDLGWRLHRAPTVPTLGSYGQLSITGSF